MCQKRSTNGVEDVDVVGWSLVDFQVQQAIFRGLLKKRLSAQASVGGNGQFC